MADNNLLHGKSLDTILFDLESLKEIPQLCTVVSAFLEGDYKTVLQNPTSQALHGRLSESVALSREQQHATIQNLGFETEVAAILALISGLAAFNGFLQANVTGPPLNLRDLFAEKAGGTSFKDQCLKSLDVDGVSVYQYIPHIELFCLARMIFTMYFPRIIQGNFIDCKWMRIRINAYHQRLLSGASAGRLMDATALQNIIDKDLKELKDEIFVSDSPFTTEAKVQFLLEKAHIHIMQGHDIKAKKDVKLAKSASGFSYALSGALGKRTKFQQNDTSQLVVFAKSKESGDRSTEGLSAALNDSSLSNKDRKAPKALDLNDDTLLESIEFAKSTSEAIDNSALPSELASLQPDQQPQLSPLDQIILLIEATIKDKFLPFDKLNNEEILPFAVRVLSDKPTNWQVYTQALLVRSRIECHRSRTQERGVLQLQVIVDQIISDTEESSSSTSPDRIPEITVTQFFPRAKANESAPITERLHYIYQLSTPTRWELETELAFAWSSAGSLISALEIFKRLKLWAEVALCYHSVGQEDKALQIIRRQLYYSSKGPEIDKFHVDAAEIASESWDGDVRSPPPPHSPRLWCILGDLTNDPSCWEKAWEISKHRYARAQRTLGEHWSKNGDFEKAREAYLQATIVNRQNNDNWSRLGDIDLRIGNWDGAIIAFQQSIMIDDTDAKTYSNLGSALLSKHAEAVSLQKVAASVGEASLARPANDGEDFAAQPPKTETPRDILRQALVAYKRGASIAHSNWQIWDNVLTIASRMSPPAFPDLLMALRSIIHIRSPSVGEAAVDIDVLRALIGEVISRDRVDINGVIQETGIYQPPRGSLARAVIEMMKSDIVPLITIRAELWTLAEKLALYTRDYIQALSCAEKAWRMSTQAAGEKWLNDKEGWKEIVGVTDNLVSAYENYGSIETEEGVLVEKSWKMKARSAVRGIMGRAMDSWEGTGEWNMLVALLEGLK